MTPKYVSHFSVTVGSEMGLADVCEFRDSESGVAETTRLLGCDVVLFVKEFNPENGGSIFI
jgi:hypothetical protein